MVLLQAFLSKLILASFEYFIIAACIDIALEQKIFTKRKLILIPFMIMSVSCNVLIPIHAIGVPLGSLVSICSYMIYIKNSLLHNLILFF